ncbi:MAG: hypothetical protein JJ992_20140, partial [Planctomycetes bacterium]|nr:hypothetical protein [Planctomycetota bacterium]
MKPAARIGVVAVILLAIAGTADAARKPKDLLQYIPADTPYVMAFTRPLPNELMDKMEPAVDETLSAYRRMIEFMLTDAKARRALEGTDEESGEPNSDEELQRLEAVMDEFMGMLSVKGLRDAGIGRDSLFAIYGDGLLPVVRFAMTDGEKFDALIARLENRADASLKVAELNGVSYQYADLDEKARLVIATPGDDAVIALVPAAYDEARLAATLGLTKPRNSLARSKTLDKIAREYDFTEHAVGFFDVQRIAASFMGDPSGLNAELLALLQYDPSQIDDTCRAEFGHLAAIAPRVVFGYTGINVRHLDAAMIVELREDIAAGLATLPAAVPGLGADPGGLFTFGFSLNPLALRAFYEARLDAMEEDPFECVALAELQASTVKGRAALAQPVPPVVYNFRGMLTSVRDITGFDFQSKQPPESVDASILFAIENAQDIVNMAALMDPRVAALNLLPDGKARKLEFPELG